MPFLVFAVLAWGSAALRIGLLSSPDRTLHHALGILIVHSLSVIAGLGGLYAFLGHSFKSDEVAAGIGWPKGNPFQREVAVANLAFSTLGIASIWMSPDFWTAAVFGFCVWMVGCGEVHVREIRFNGNRSALNSGGILVFTFAVPVILLLLLIAYHAT